MPGPAPPDLLAGFKSGDRDKRRRKGKTQEGWTAEGGEQRKQRRGGEGRRDGKEGVRRGGEISLPQSFLKVGAYGQNSSEFTFVLTDAVIIFVD